MLGESLIYQQFNRWLFSQQIHTRACLTCTLFDVFVHIHICWHMFRFYSICTSHRYQSIPNQIVYCHRVSHDTHVRDVRYSDLLSHFHNLHWTWKYSHWKYSLIWSHLQGSINQTIYSSAIQIWSIKSSPFIAKYRKCIWHFELKRTNEQLHWEGGREIGRK